MNYDDVFKALSDPSRRKLMDILFEQDGQSLNQLCEHLPMSRYGVMKHLQVLEDVGLITTEKVGREKHHYLNAVPLQITYERWVSKYAQPFASALTGLKTIMESDTMSQKLVQQIFIQTTPDRLWQALTDGKITRQYYFGSEVESDWNVGSSYRYPNPAGGTFIEGEILDSDPPHRLVMSFQPVFQYPDATPPTSTVTWQIEVVGSACKLTLTHEQLDFDDERNANLAEGWAQIISGLKTVLETGKPLDLGG